MFTSDLQLRCSRKKKAYFKFSYNKLSPLSVLMQERGVNLKSRAFNRCGSELLLHKPQPPVWAGQRDVVILSGRGLSARQTHDADPFCFEEGKPSKIGKIFLINKSAQTCKPGQNIFPLAFDPPAACVFRSSLIKWFYSITSFLVYISSFLVLARLTSLHCLAYHSET